MTFSVNGFAVCGKEGKFVTSRHLRERLFRELLKDVSLRVNETDTTDAFRVCGRGEMHLSILIENLRREGYEFQVGAHQGTVQGNRRRQVRAGRAHDCRRTAGRSWLDHGEDGQPQGRTGSMNPKGADRMRLEFLIPARGLFGYRTEFLTDTKGEGVLSSGIPQLSAVQGRNLQAHHRFADRV